MALKVMLCCNDHRNGSSLGYAEHVEIEDVSIAGGRVSVNHLHVQMKSAERYQGDTTLRVGRLLVPCLGYSTWVGNWCWDCASVRAIEALRLLNYLAAKPDWHVEEAACEIYEAFNDRRKVTPEEWKRYLNPTLTCTLTGNGEKDRAPGENE